MGTSIARRGLFQATFFYKVVQHGNLPFVKNHHRMFFPEMGFFLSPPQTSKHLLNSIRSTGRCILLHSEFYLGKSNFRVNQIKGCIQTSGYSVKDSNSF
ncbi:MAG: hypothetical protein HUK21_09530 [Fibrobacteraceae bacterium]|nr:hypothetical protein [Fibrobacteraceae bacterium]